MTRYQKTVFTSFLVFLPAGVAAVIWFQLMRASSSAVVVGGEITILVIALAINQAALIVPLRRRFAAAVERQDADAVDAVLDEAAAMWPRNAKMRAFVDGNRAVALMFRERWDEAVAQARSALAGPLARTQEALLLNSVSARWLARRRSFCAGLQTARWAQSTRSEGKPIVRSGTWTRPTRSVAADALFRRPGSTIEALCSSRRA
ncbi:MAG: hypothetical protein DMG03_21115 [Acidobacteria bacterium]|nr:MAG: hypothetical protein DMG03_21115 [Acidobacteriota bacterium]